VGADDAAHAVDHPDTDPLEARADVRGLLVGQVQDAVADPAHVRVDLGPAEVDPQVHGGAHAAHRVGGGDQRLGGDHVREDGRAAHPLALDQGHAGAQLRGHHGGLVAAGAAADDGQGRDEGAVFLGHAPHCVPFPGGM
jgi:hypothetical protein